MLYMLAPMPAGGHHTAAPWVPAMSGTDLALPVVAWLLAGYFVAHATLLGPLVVPPRDTGDQGLPPILTARRLTATCQVFMALGTAYLLVG